MIDENGEGYEITGSKLILIIYDKDGNPIKITKD